jgi:arylsulfatase A-like enzyme
LTKDARSSKPTRREVIRNAALAGVAASLARRSEGAAPAARPPNILLILPDQHRHDAIGAAGDPVVATPTLDRLAREGTLFTRVWCQGPSCRPARASLITCRYPHQHGIVGPNAPANDPSWPTVMKRLQAAGYVTATFGKTDYGFKDKEGREVASDGGGGKDEGEAGGGRDVREMLPFIRSFGWDYVSENPSQIDIALPGYGSSYTDYLREHGLFDLYCRQVRAHWRGSLEQYSGFVSEIPAEHDLASFVARETIAWLGTRDRSRPFFVTFAPNKPHHPYNADSRWASFYAGKSMPGGPRDRVTPTNPLWAKVFEERYRKFPPESISEAFIEQSKRMYYGAISLVDQKVGEILRVLEDKGELDSTWVFYSSDHGELMGDHKLFDKTLFYHSSVGVPGIVRPPGGAPAPRRVDAPAEAIDLAATILDVAGAEALDAPGRSLLPAMRGEQGPRYAFSEMARSKDTLYVAVTDGRWRYTVEARSKTPCELFDLASDPDEVTNLVADPGQARRVAQMQGDLIEPHLAGRVL